MKTDMARYAVLILLPAALLLTACAPGASSEEASEPALSAENTDPSDTSQAQEPSTKTASDTSQAQESSAKTDSGTSAPNETAVGSTSAAPASAPENDYPDPYTMETYDSVPSYLLEWMEDVEYGPVDTDLEYYSETAGDVKYCNVLLPAGYDKSQEYPVLYMIHGWGGAYDSHIHEGSILQKLYGNMLSEGLAVPMIIVGVDMYTDPLADKDSKSDEEMRLSYNKTVDDIALSLMPFIEEHYSVKKGRTNTAITGVSEGATICLAAGFKWQSKIAYIGSFAPCPGVIPTPYAKGTYWNWPILDDFTIESAETMPRYIYLTVGSEDPWCVDVTAYYGRILDEKGIPNQNDLVEGYDHDNDMWALGHYNFLQKIFLD